MTKIGLLLVYTLLLSFSGITIADNSKSQDGDPRAEFENLRFSTTARTSPFDPPSENAFVADVGPGLDTGCTFNDSPNHPLLIDIIIDKAVGPVDNNGFLIDPDELIAQGVIPSRVNVLMPAYDVDVNGNPPPEIDEAWLNGVLLGTLNGDNQIWSLNSFSIDVRKLKFPVPGSSTGAINQVQINIDTLSSGRWCSAIDWIALNLEIKPVIALKLTPANNNPVWKDNSTPILHVFEQNIDNNCDLIDDTSSAKEKAFSAAGRSGNAVVDINTELATCGGTNALSGSEVTVNWSIQGTSQQGNARWTGNSGTVGIDVPQQIGAYSISLDYSVDGNTLPTVTRTLYVTKAAPTISRPLAFWYEQATSWANGKTNDSDILTGVLQGLFTYGNSHWDYGYDFGAAKKCSWRQLMDESLTCDYSDCYVFSDVFENMSGLLGVSGLSPVIKVGKGQAKAFVTNATPSLDPAFTGSAKPIGGGYDRYLFSSHSLRQRAGKYYDATFNGTYNVDDAFIAWNADSIKIDARGPHYLTLEGAKIYQLMPASPTKYEKAWGAFEYIPPSNIRQIQITKEESIMIDKRAGSLIVSQSTFEPIDENSNTRFNKLKVIMSIDFPSVGFYNITAQLLSNNELVANQSSMKDSRPVGMFYNATQSGVHQVEFEFSGQQIFESELNGPYEARVTVLGLGGDFEVAVISPAYSHTEFGELDASINSLSETSIDSDSDSLFDQLQINTDINSTIAGDYLFKATLLGKGETIDNLVLPVTLTTGNNNITASFNGVKINRSEMNGPYEIIINLTQFDDVTIHSMTLQTQNYSYSEFETLVDINGLLRAQGLDTNHSGLFNQLVIDLPITPRALGDYVLSGKLTDITGQKSTFYQAEVQLRANTDMLTFVFDGISINTLEMNGSYSLSFTLKEKNTDYISDPISVRDTTQSFKFEDFESNETNNDVSLTGVTSDLAFDSNGNSLFEQLDVSVGVNVQSTGFYSWSASLEDVNANEIELTSGGVSLSAGDNQVVMSFSGTLIGNNGIAGPFFVKNFLIFSSNGSNLVASHVATTQGYQADQFEGFIAATEGDFDADGDVDRNDITLLMAQLNQLVTAANAAMDLNSDGKITITDARKLRLLCTRQSCAA